VSNATLFLVYDGATSFFRLLNARPGERLDRVLVVRRLGAPVRRSPSGELVLYGVCFFCEKIRDCVWFGKWGGSGGGSPPGAVRALSDLVRSRKSRMRIVRVSRA
jgi:hypothetical protein